MNLCDSQNTEKCVATLTWRIAALVPQSELYQMKAPRMVPEAESVFLLRSPNLVYKKKKKKKITLLYKLPRTDLDNEKPQGRKRTIPD